MKHLRWFIIGLHLYVFPPDPEVGGMVSFKNWKPRKMSIWETLKFRWYTGIWSYTSGNL